MYNKLAQKYNERRKELLKFCEKRVLYNCSFLAEDCLNEAFTKLCDAISRGKHIEDDFDNLLFKVLFNAIYDCNEQEILRGMTGRKKTRSSFKEINIINKDVSDIYGIEDENSDIFRKVAVSVSLDKLDDYKKKIKRILQLYYYDGYDHKQIGWLCGVSEKTSRNVVSLHLAEIKNG